METLFAEVAGNAVLQIALLIVGPFVLEEAAIVSAAALAASGELGAATAFAAVFVGMVVSDWALYGAGWAAGRSRRVRAWVGEDAIARGRTILGRGALAAAMTARLIPWMLFPIFVASGFLGIGLARFVAVNAAVAFVYTGAAFLSLYWFNVALFDLFEGWGWLAAVLAGVIILAAVLLAGRRYRGGGPSDRD
ncbi:MAG: hypothetical protein ACK4U0_09140 [Mesorhizobium sp.]